ncbi:tripartite motif-containing protein 2-like [Dreissena polymorpha]|uniref:RING-type domain-containing protein n=1 Tax=Dreissena polymorpha TaxID=45954 RepID=A0A9D4CD74_DREPO|nr:tripartite motif-containing protein 2-like [Dreissena polymorpha]XP_052247443.1 tripartite motif-containing protein 2-like [Dreissena polymorpha]KAH3721524.1 hypothetical protein DPMN_064453 [Dreissena polymorpha]
MSKRDKSPAKSKTPVAENPSPKQESFIKCELCRHTLDNPKTLECLHSFCRDCLMAYISETVGKGPAPSGVTVCPVCLQTSPPPVGSKSKEQWSDDFPTNEFLKSYLEASALKDPNKKCDTCHRQDKEVDAQQWCPQCHDALCDDCVSFHNALKTTKLHKTVYLSKVRNQPIENIISHPHCPDHAGETVTRYCETHDDIGCEKCVATKHKSCKDVRPLKDAAHTHQSEINKIKSTLGDATKLARALYDDRFKADKTLDDVQANMLIRIQSIRKKINENLLKCESQIIGELYDVHGKEKAVIQSEMKEAQRIRKSCGMIHGLCESSSKYGTEYHVLENRTKAATQSEYYKGKLGSLNNRIKQTKMDFVVDPILEKLMSGVSRLGDIRMTSSPAELPVTQNLKIAKHDSDPEDELDMRGSRRTLQADSKSLRSMRLSNLYANLQAAFSARSDSDTELCWFTGIAYLPNGNMVLVDRNNSKLKLIDKTFRLVGEHKMEHQPFGLTFMLTNQIAVTTPRENQVEIYEVGATFKLLDSFRISDRGYGISYGGEKFAVICSCASNPSIKVISRNGEEKQDLCPVDNYHPMFLRPWYVKLDPSGTYMYVSDCHRSHVTCISGTVLKQFVYQDSSLNSPRGMYITKDKRVLVCGFGTDNVQLLSSDGALMGDLLARNDDVMGPQDVALTLAEDKMAVTFDPSSGKSDTVHVYGVNL